MAHENDRGRQKNEHQESSQHQVRNKGNLGQKDAKQQAKSESELAHMDELSKTERK